MGYKGIYSKKSKDGTTSIYARFKHQNKTYPVKNLTKLFGCTTEKQGSDKLQEIKVLMSKGQNPFETTLSTLDDIFSNAREKNYKSGLWSKTTYDNYGYFYNAYVKDKIGYLKLEKITYEKLMKVQEQVAHLSNSSKNYLRMILRPIFEEEVKKGNIAENVVAKLKYHGYSIRESLETRINENYLDVVKKLYKEIPHYIPNKKNQREELKYFLYLTILTAHRYGEILQLTKEDYYMEEGLINPPKAITKTDDDYRFPIALFFEKTERIAYLKDILNEVSQKFSVISGKNIADKHLYQDQIIENYEFKKSLKNKASSDDSEKTGDGTSNNDISKEDKIVLDSDFFSYIT